MWFRLVGVRISNEVLVCYWLVHVGKLVFATFCGALGFVLCDPLQETSRIVTWQWQQLLKHPEKQWNWFYSFLTTSSLSFYRY